MSFIEVERSVRSGSWTMQGLHAHPHYEIYYLYQGSRQLLLANALYHMEAPSLAVIPPGAPHKTEGGPFARFNINVSPDYANPFQREVLQARALGAVPLSPEEHSAMFPLLEDLERCPPGGRHSGYVIQALFGYLMVLLSRVEAASHQGLTVERPLPPLVLKVLDYLYSHYQESQSLDSLVAQFFVSKATILYNFKRYLHTSPMDFLLNLRLEKAKEALETTNKSVCQIAEECGFRSANYFSLIFKRKEQLSPLHYRKHQRAKG